MIGGPLGISLAPAILKSRYWTRVLTPIAKWYVNVAGYRQMGMKYDDLSQFHSLLALSLILTGFYSSHRGA